MFIAMNDTSNTTATDTTAGLDQADEEILQLHRLRRVLLTCSTG